MASSLQGITMKMTVSAAALSAVLLTVSSADVAFGQAKPRPIPTGPASVQQSKPNELFNGWKLSPAV